jgi:hypothetical protein
MSRTANVVLFVLVFVAGVALGNVTSFLERPDPDTSDATKARCVEDCIAFAKHDTVSRKRICAKYTEADQMWYSTACDQPAWLDPKSFRPLYQPATEQMPASCLCFAGHWKYPEMGVLW